MRVPSLIACAVVLVFGVACESDTVTCVAEGTRIVTPSGDRLVEELSVGDAVLSVDPRTGRAHRSRIVALREAKRKTIFLKTETGEALWTTPEHPIYSAARKEYRRAETRVAGAAYVARFNGGFVEDVRVVENRKDDSIRRVFDLTVDSPFENFVAGGILVHNKSPVIEDFQPADTQDKLIQSLERAYRERDLFQYAKLLDPDFEFFFAEADIEDIQKEFWNRQEEINAVERMFSGQPSRDGESIQSITIALIPLGTGGWSLEVPPEFAGSTSRNYCVNMDVRAGDTTFQVRGLQRFYATEMEGAFQLVGWEDRGVYEDCGFKTLPIENRTWGSVKALFQ